MQALLPDRTRVPRPGDSENGIRPDADAFRNSLAKGGVDGTLQKRYAGLDGRVFAKTGYIEGVRALSGYVRTFDDQ